MNRQETKPAEPAKDGKAIWVFTPSRSNPEDLEFILVQRQKLLQDAVERVRESVLTKNKHQLLFVGPRGCGKTHLVTLIVSRLRKDAKLADKLRIAWLNEDETCTSLLELLLKIHAALEKRYQVEYREEMLAAAYEKSPAEAIQFVSKHLLATLDSRTLVLVVENLDAIFEGLGAEGQKELRAFIQENSKLAIVATAQRLVQDLADRASPFFGFFQTEHLKPLNVEEATELLQNIAQLHGKNDVVQFLATARGRARVRALHHLSGGNHRIYIVLSQFITGDNVDALLGPFLKMVDELTPYYQERIRWLSALQRKIVEFLCVCTGTVPVKEIARRLFATPQTISSQLKDLREKGYVEANERGRESLYEVSEPLMRICVEVKENQDHQPLRLLVDFLRIWYDDQELKRRLGKLEPNAISCVYLQSAIERNSAEGNLRRQLILNHFQSALEDFEPAMRVGFLKEMEREPEAVLVAMESLSEGNMPEALNCLDEAIVEESDPSKKATLILHRAHIQFVKRKREGALADYTSVIGLRGASVDQVVKALFGRSQAHHGAGHIQDEIKDLTAVIELPKVPTEQLARAYFNRGVVNGRAEDQQREIEDYTMVIQLADAPAEIVAMAFVNRANTHFRMGRTKLALEDYSRVIHLPGAPVKQVAMALFNRGKALDDIGEKRRCIDDYTAVILLPNAPIQQVAAALLNRAAVLLEAGQIPRASEDCTALIGLPGAPVESVARALVLRGIIYRQTGKRDLALKDHTMAIGLPGISVEQVARAFVNRGRTHGEAGETQREIEDYTSAIALPGAPVEGVASALIHRGDARRRTAVTSLAIEDYTRAIGLSGASIEQLTRALANRAEAYAETGDVEREIEDYTAVIELAGAPTERIATALVNRGLVHRQLGKMQCAIDDFTRAMELADVPAGVVAKAAMSRGAIREESGEIQHAVDDFTIVSELVGVPAEWIIRALICRAITYFNSGRKQEARVDFESVMNHREVPTNFLVDSATMLAFLHAGESRWKESLEVLNRAFESGKNEKIPYFGKAASILEAVFTAGLSPLGRQEQVFALLEVYRKYQALAVLGEGLVQHMGDTFLAGEPFPSADNLEGWAVAWEKAAEGVADFRLSVRLLRTAVEFIKAGGKNPGTLLDLTSSERAILEQAFGLDEAGA